MKNTFSPNDLMQTTILCVWLFSFNGVRAQQSSGKWMHTLSAEAYQFEMVQTNSVVGYLTANYCGQSLRYAAERKLLEHFSIGAETGLFFHVRGGDTRVSFHSYVPLQMVLRLVTKTQRFAVSLSVGCPLMLTKKEPYVGTKGLWYRNVWHVPGMYDQKFFDSQARIVDNYYLLAAMKCHFSVLQTNKWFVNVGVQYYGFSSHLYNGGDYKGEFNEFKYGNCVNLLGGISYRFGR